MDSILGMKRKLTIGYLHGNGHEYRVIRHFQVIGPPVKVHLIPDDAGGHYRLEVLELHLRRFIYLGEEFQPREFVHARGCSAHGSRHVRAVRAREAVGLRRHAHGFHQAQARARHVQ